jgi:hypothetical protein
MPIQLIEDYFRSYDKATYRVSAQQGAEPSEAEVRAFISQHDFPIDDELVAILTHPLGGLFMDVSPDIWPESREYDVGPAWTFMRGVMAYTLSPDAPDWLSMARRREEMSALGYPQFLPFFRVIGEADDYCLTKDGRIVIWRHDDPDEPEPVSMSVTELIMHEIRELEQRAEQMKLRRRDKKP